MQKKNRPAVDKAIVPVHGVSRDGQPLSYNRAPAADIAPWVGGLYVTKVEAPADYRLACGLFCDAPFVRVQLAGKWEAETASGLKQYARAAVFCGPHSRRMPISVTGSFISVGLSIRAGACAALEGMKVGDHLDQLAMLEDVDGIADGGVDNFDPEGTPEDWLQVLENLVRKRAERADGALPDPITQRFESIAFADPSVSVAEFAKDCGVDKRRIERIVSRDFGMSPKKVLRRARALDMASHLRGVADHNEAEELMLRYYDQSHLIRDFIELFGMSPSQFVAQPQPILTLALESRQARRLEAISRLNPGAVRPWE